MAGETIVTIVGNVTNDPELRFISGGAGVVNFTVASNSSYFNKNTNQWEDKGTLFVRCEAWRAQADNVAETLKKGMRVIVQGELVVNTYTKQDGTTGTSVELKNTEVGVSLKYAKAQVEKVSGGYNQNQGGYGNQGAPQQPNAGNFGGQGGYGVPQGGNAGDQWGQSSSSSFDSNEPPPF